MDRARTLIRCVLSALLVASLGTAPVAAQTPPPSEPPEPTGVTLIPKTGSPGISTSGTHFEFGLVPPGRAIKGQLLARNIGDETESAILYGADATPARGGGFGFTTNEETPRLVGAWLRLDRDRITLKGKETATIGFELVVPEGAPGGEHVGGLILQDAEPTSTGAVAIGTRIAVGVYLTVQGGSAQALRPSITITKLRAPVSGGEACPTLGYTNTGTAVLDPTAEIVVDPKLPGKTKSYPVGKVGGVPPGTSIEVELPCVAKVPIGGSTLTVRLGFPGGGAERGTDITHWPFAVYAAGSLLLLLILLLLLWLFLAKRRNDDEEEVESSGAGHLPAGS
ncbi:MAG TPA: hypothetical protein VNA12_07760 [Mycobacteriales bacterium]|nr:hypothetical protein [Mycobacteriales bacterium]